MEGLDFRRIAYGQGITTFCGFAFPLEENWLGREDSNLHHPH